MTKPGSETLDSLVPITILYYTTEGLTSNTLDSNMTDKYRTDFCGLTPFGRLPGSHCSLSVGACELFQKYAWVIHTLCRTQKTEPKTEFYSHSKESFSHIRVKFYISQATNANGISMAQLLLNQIFCWTELQFVCIFKNYVGVS